MAKSQVLCLGEILWDCLADQPAMSVDAVQSWTHYPGGAPANVACALVKLGTLSSFIGCVGTDAPGQSLVDLLQTIGVEISGVQRHPAPTRHVEVLRSISGDRQFAGFGGRSTTEFADTHLQAKALPEALFNQAEYLVMGTLALAYPETRRAMERAIELANQQYLKIVIDVNWRPMFWPEPDQAKSTILSLIQQADFLKLSYEEAEWLYGTADPRAIVQQHGDAEGVLVTNGDQGCAYCLSEQSGQLPAFPIHPLDTTGAGDSFLAGFIHQLCKRGIRSLTHPDTAKQIVTYASAVGALTTLKPGAIAAQPTAIEVEAFLDKES
ncbi:carbohydrate kinase family protein [Egbenema bharatensis]|uniref:carbohydrate kinase family protein n=1 Tax=Egbenema bharatensis TaxID=3463334 RepID=UPI003A861E06